MPYQFDIQKFNNGDEEQFSRYYSLRFKTVLIYAKYKTHDQEKAWLYANMAFQQLKNHKTKDFHSISQITQWLKQTIGNLCLVYDSNKPS